jgi:hypothetical protein
MGVVCCGEGRLGPFPLPYFNSHLWIDRGAVCDSEVGKVFPPFFFWFSSLRAFTPPGRIEGASLHMLLP